MYKKTSYKYSGLYSVKTGKNAVLEDFMYDVMYCQITNIRYCKTIFYVAFHGEKFTCIYILPIKCKNLVEGVEKQ